MELLDQPGWLWGLSLIVLTMAIHATAVVVLAFVGGEDTGAVGNHRPQGVEPYPDPDLCSRRIWTAIGRAARNRVRDLGSGVFVAWRSRLAHGRLVLFARLDEHARRIGADAATTLALDGRAGGSRRDATVRCEHGVPLLGDAGVLVHAHRARGP